MRLKMKLSFVVFLGLLCHVSSYTFEDVGDPEVEFGSYSVNTQQVTVNELNDAKDQRITVVNLIDVKDTLRISPIGSIEELNPTIDDGADSTTKSVSVNRLDYELLRQETGQFSIIFDIYEGPARQTLNVMIKNLDDESPSLSVSTCIIPENQVTTVDNSECIFTVEDPDGWLATMDFTAIDGSNDEANIFALEYKTSPADNVYSSDVYLVLQEGKQLDYEDRTIYSFRIAAKDNGGHPTTPLPLVSIVVQVEDLPDVAPIWDSFISARTIPEKAATEIIVSAKDGDYGINSAITYTIEDNSGYIHIEDPTKGTITVDAIDRDAGNDQVVFSVIATEVEEPHTPTVGQITLIIEDIDDHIPEITIVGSDEKKIDVEVNEGSSEIPVEIVVTDLDLGANAMYTAELTPTSNEDFLSAFQIIPGKGYEETALTLTVVRPELLDFENPSWRVIEMELHTKGTVNQENTDVVPIKITLIDLNDEIPKFEQDEFQVNITEDTAGGIYLTTILATDRDAEDQTLKHELLGTLANNILVIEADTGRVSTKIDNAFDYEKQNEISVQIRATDKAGHSATAQLTIHVEDVNDENPRLLVSSTMVVEENQPDGFVIESSITASDEDTTADLEFSINWDESYVTKNSISLPPVQCVKVDTVPGEDNHQANAKFSIIELDKDNTPDYEAFDNLYIRLVVTDKNTANTEGDKDGTDSALVVINIQDINDNPPVFLENTASAPRSILDGASGGATVTTVTATDRDVGDTVTYSIQSADDDTPEWVAIDEHGNIVVAEGVIIDCDDPVRYNLVYTVIATDSDQVHNTPINITIAIQDQNDWAPTLTNQDVTIQEDNELTPEVTQEGNTLITLVPEDKDRDDQFKTVRCSIDASSGNEDITSRFRVQDNKIVVTLSGGATLNFEEQAQYDFILNCVDNPSSPDGSVSLAVNPPPRVSIKLTDINDNYPIITTNNIPGVSENTKKGPISTKITGQDLDSNDNGLMEFSIGKIRRFLDSDHQNEVDVDQALFTIQTDDNKKEATLSVAADDLSGDYGYLQLTITTTDLGDPPLSKDNVVDLQVDKYNFKEPVFEFPVENTPYYLKSQQNANSRLTMWNDDPFPVLQANDQQDNKYLITFQVVEDSSGVGLFRAYNLANSQADLQVSTGNFDPRVTYTIKIMASIGADRDPVIGEASFTANCTITVGFFDQDTTDPTFQDHAGTADFEENSLEPTYAVENATYPSVAISGLPVFYLIRTGDDTIFDIDINTGVVSLKQALDFETQSSYELTIQSSNRASAKPDAGDDTKFQLTINVRDVNDNPPVFEQKEYVATLLTTVATAAEVMVQQVVANDLDTTSNGKLTYAIDGIKGSTDALASLPNPFKIRETTGEVIVGFDVDDSMSGYFNITVSVQDEDPGEDHRDTTLLRVFLVSSKNTVNFKFQNEQTMVLQATDKIKDVLDDEFNYETNVETPKEDGSNTTVRTVVPIFFLDLKSNEPLDGTVILNKVTNVDTFRRLQKAFAVYSLNLLSFSSESTETQNLETILKAWLIGVSVVLGSLCLILLIAFILKTRALNQRINKLSNTKFGSDESGLNRTGVADAPTTNKHALEGSNPVYNNDVDTKDLERVSVTSGDSDLIGVEEDDKFNYNYSNKDDVIE